MARVPNSSSTRACPKETSPAPFAPRSTEALLEHLHGAYGVSRKPRAAASNSSMSGTSPSSYAHARRPYRQCQRGKPTGARRCSCRGSPGRSRTLAQHRRSSRRERKVQVERLDPGDVRPLQSRARRRRSAPPAARTPAACHAGGAAPGFKSATNRISRQRTRSAVPRQGHATRRFRGVASHTWASGIRSPVASTASA